MLRKLIRTVHFWCEVYNSLLITASSLHQYKTALGRSRSKLYSFDPIHFVQTGLAPLLQSVHGVLTCNINSASMRLPLKTNAYLLEQQVDKQYGEWVNVHYLFMKLVEWRYLVSSMPHLSLLKATWPFHSCRQASYARHKSAIVTEKVVIAASFVVLALCCSATI